jgi:hypothetical protein
MRFEHHEDHEEREEAGYVSEIAEAGSGHDSITSPQKWNLSISMKERESKSGEERTERSPPIGEEAGIP